MNSKDKMTICNPRVGAEQLNIPTHEDTTQKSADVIAPLEANSQNKYKNKSTKYRRNYIT